MSMVEGLLSSLSRIHRLRDGHPNAWLNARVAERGAANMYRRPIYTKVIAALPTMHRISEAKADPLLKLNIAWLLSLN